MVWEIGTGYFGARTKDGGFDPEQFREKAAHDAVKCVSLKLSQGAKPGIGGVLPGAKVTKEIADARSVPKGQTCVSPPGHKVFSHPARADPLHRRDARAGRRQADRLQAVRRLPPRAAGDLQGDGRGGHRPRTSSSSTGPRAAPARRPAEYEDHVGTPLTEGLMMLHNALVGCGLRDRIRIGASGKVATGSDIVKRLAQGADYTNAARAMMMAVGCIQSQRCHTNQCPVGVATQDPKRSRALDVPDKTERVYRYQHATVAEAQRLIASMGLHSPAEVGPHHLVRRVDHVTSRSYAELYDWLEPGQLLDEPPESWPADWARADPDSFAPRAISLRSAVMADRRRDDRRRRSPTSACGRSGASSATR